MESADKDLIDAKLQAVIERMNGDARAHQLATDARFVQLNQTLESGLKSAQKDNELHRAQTEAYLQKVVSEVAKSQSEIVKSQSEITRSQGELIKWVAAISVASAAITISATTLLVTQSTPKNPAPIVIYAQPAPVAPLVAPATPRSQQ